MIVVSNTTPLIGLASIQRFDLLQQIFGELYIAQAVYDEAVVAGREIGGAKREILAATWINVIHPPQREAVDVLLEELDLGEAETIVVAGMLQSDWVLMDERKGRQKLTQLGLNKIGTVGILLRAKQLGLIANLRHELEELRRHGFSISQGVIDAVVQEAHE